MKAQLANHPQPSFCQKGAHALLAALSFSVIAAGCSSSSDPEVNDAQVGAAVQDLVEDRDGHTIAVSVEGSFGAIVAGSVEASAGQNATMVTLDGNRVLIEFDDRVTPSHQVRFVGIEGLTEEWISVTTTDPRTPRLGILGATQDVSDNELGGDQITIAFVAGPRVIQSEAENPDNWVLRVEGFALDLAGTVIGINPATQVATLTLGPLANLHANFTLAANVSTVADIALSPSPVQGTANGDAVAPGLDGVNPVLQDIVPATLGDEFGRVITIDFDEPISPVFGAAASNFSVLDHVDAVGVTSVTRVAVDEADNTKVRVSFSRPVVPGLDQITIDGVVDAHGNAFAAQTADLAAGSTTANGFTSVNFNTIEGLGNDSVVAVLDQAIDPDTADDPARWTLDIDSTPVVLAPGDISYDLATKTVTIELGEDFINGLSADLSSAGVVDIDGDIFSVPAAPAAAAGDALAPTIVFMTQNRDVDVLGTTIDVAFSEPLDVMEATDAANYTFAPVITVDSATLIGGDLVRLALQEVAVPGDVTLTVSQAISDPAGNDLGSDVGPEPLSSTDVLAPTVLSSTAQSIEGAENDALFAFFSDSLIPAEAEDVSRWSLESPIGTPWDLTGSSVSYNTSTRVATLSLTGSGVPSFLVGEDFEVSITSIRDLGGNASDPMEVMGQATGESHRPGIEGLFISGVAGNQISVRFSEPMLDPANLYDENSNVTGARYGLIDPVTSEETFPASAVANDLGLGVILTYGSAVDPTATVNVIGLRDAAGNILFPVVGAAIQAEDTTDPVQAGAPGIAAVEGTNNDSVTVTFNVPMSAWQIKNRDAYVLRNVGTGLVMDLSNASFEFDGTDTLTITLGINASLSFDGSATYDLELLTNGINTLRTVQGVELSGTDAQSGVAVTGDVTTGPILGGTSALTVPGDPSALVVVFSETVQAAAATTETEYDFGGGSIATSVSRINDRSFYVSFGAPVSVGGVLDVTATAAIDTAGNAASGTLSIPSTEDVTPPFASSVTATIADGTGGDRIVVEFNEMLDADVSIPVEQFEVTSGGSRVRVGFVAYDPQALTATLFVEDLVDGQSVAVSVTGLTDVVGNAPGAPMTGSALPAGDSVTPEIVAAFVNLEAASNGTTIDVQFSEDVNTLFALVGGNWTVSTGETITAAEAFGSDHVRLQLSGPIGSAATLTLGAGLTDSAGNEAPDLVVDPVE